MDQETTRRHFLRGGSLAAAGLAAAGATGAAQDPAGHQGHDMHAHAGGGGYPRDRPGPGGPVGSPTDRGKLVPG